MDDYMAIDEASISISPFHKTLPRSSLPTHWISVMFYEMGDILKESHGP